MIRGALLLTVGFGLGYAKALYDVPAIQDGLVTVIELLKGDTRERVIQNELNTLIELLKEERAARSDNEDNNDEQGETS